MSTAVSGYLRLQGTRALALPHRLGRGTLSESVAVTLCSCSARRAIGQVAPKWKRLKASQRHQIAASSCTAGATTGGCLMLGKSVGVDKHERRETI